MNRIKLITHRDPDVNVNRSAIYKYISGELVDLSCLKVAGSCTMNLNFSHPDRLDGTVDNVANFIKFSYFVLLLIIDRL